MNEYSMMLEKRSRRPYLIEERKVDYEAARRLCSPDAIVDMMNTCFRISEKAEEHVYMLTMNAKLDTTGVFLIGKGCTTKAMCSIKDMFTRAMLAGACGIVMVHNHPSGDATPSKEDMQNAKQVATAGALLEVELIDSIVVGNGTYCSIRTIDSNSVKPRRVPNEWIR